MPTSPAFYHALQAIERLILEEKQRCIDRLFIDATGGGARIDGTRIIPLEEISAVLGSQTAKPQANITPKRAEDVEKQNFASNA